GKCVGTVDIKDVTVESLSEMMVGRKVCLQVNKEPQTLGEDVLAVENLTVASKNHNNNAVKDISFEVKRGEILCIAGIEGN
ncbi:MAG: heme ABC transporter ATP-binding protein, partial [Clostridia bacterium]